MKKAKKVIIIISILIVLAFGSIFAIYKIFKDKNSLTISEKTWINNNKNSLYSIAVPNDINIFGLSGTGVFYDFISDLEEDLSLKLNSTVYSVNNTNESFGFTVSNSYDKRDLLIYTDYYVIINNSKNTLNKLEDINSNKVGIMSNDLNYISTYYKLTSTITTYDNSDTLIKALTDKELDYIILPLNQYKDDIINKNLNICYFLNDAKIYYYLHLGNDNTLNSILTKYYNTWILDDYKESYNRNNYELFIDSLGISDIDEDKLTDLDFTFDYIDKKPYTLVAKGDFTGIANSYLKSFEEFSNIDLNYKREKTFNALKNNIKKNKIDLYFNQFIYENNYQDININYPVEYYLISNKNTLLNIDSLNSYTGEIYVEEYSNLYNYLQKFKNITIKTYKNNSKIKNIIKKGNIVIVDKLVYDNYIIDNLNDSLVLFSDTALNLQYTFKYKNNNDTFYKLFSSYVNTLNPKEMTLIGINNYFDNYASGNRTVIIARYLLLLIIVILILAYLIIKSKKRIVLNTKVKNNDKIKYVDMLTSLKNRNYLNDRLEIWNQNTVYPQCVIVLDLNNIKYLNDTFGHEEGDKQIKACANILFKTQLENTEVLRTDGNEFMIYLVGYSEKQVISYIKKLLKEFKKLPYEYGVAVGFSMIKDDLKLIEDAFNEATIQMRKNKEKYEDINE